MEMVSVSMTLKILSALIHIWGWSLCSQVSLGLSLLYVRKCSPSGKCESGQGQALCNSPPPVPSLSSLPLLTSLLLLQAVTLPPASTRLCGHNDLISGSSCLPVDVRMLWSMDALSCVYTCSMTLASDLCLPPIPNLLTGSWIYSSKSAH